ncbi:MAG: hypothetical protein H0T93_00130 [Chloroflexia bacterium]|nr:hypothetical protein [Chloroflexia bacterium]
MNRAPASASPPRFVTPSHEVHDDWVRDGLATGFIATFAMTVSMAAAYAVANTFGDASGNVIARWFAALSSNEMTDNVGDIFAFGMILNLIMGLVWALLYARLAEPRLEGPGWRKGALFSLIPWALSILVFFPIAGIGVLGTGIDAGILPVLGNLILHLVFGIVLGTLYAMEVGNGANQSRHDLQANSNSVRTSALGMLAGAALGFIGGWLVAPGMDNIANQPVIAFAGALSGAAIGMLIGSLLGLKVDDERA